MKRPAFQWYPGDHRRDTAVQACSFEARALWREMLDLMHDGEPRGHLTAGGVAITDEQLARLVGAPVARVRGWLTELRDRRVFSVTPAGVMYSRRMVRDEHVSQVRREAGKHGGNPNLVKQTDKQAVNQNGSKPASKSQPLQFAVADCGLRTAVAVASSAYSSLLESSNTRSLSGAAAAPPADARVLNGLATVDPDVAEFVRRHYGGANPRRQVDVLQQLLDSLTVGARFDKRTRVKAGSPERLAAKCRELNAEGVNDPDKAIRVLLLKLGDTSDGSAPGVLEREADQLDASHDADDVAQADAWIASRPDLSREIDRQLDADGLAAADEFTAVSRAMARRALVVSAWRAGSDST